MSRLLPITNESSDGLGNLSGTAAPIDSSCSGTAGTYSLSATNASFAAGQHIFIHQSRGTGVGAYEENIIASYTSGTITTALPLENTYTDSGSSQAQVLVVPVYSKVTVGSTYTVKAWDGNVGGIIFIRCSGSVDITSTVAGNGGNGSNSAALDNQTVAGGTGGGFRGGLGRNDAQDTKISNAAEGSAGAEVGYQNSANGSGGGGGGTNANENAHGGGGGGNASAGTTGGGAQGGVGGSATGDATLATIFFGGGGGGGWVRESNATSSGASGGAIVIIICKKLNLTGSINVNGGVGGGTNTGGGGGAGGSVLIRTLSSTIGSGLITASGGSGGSGGSASGGAGSNGRIRIETGSLSGTSTPSASTNVGNNSWQGSVGIKG